MDERVGDIEEREEQPSPENVAIMQDQIEQSLSAMVSSDVLRRGQMLMEQEKSVYGGMFMRAKARLLSQNYIYKLAGVSHPDQPITPQLHAATELMALAVSMVYTKVDTELLAHAIKEIGFLSHAMHGDLGARLPEVDDGMPIARDIRNLGKIADKLPRQAMVPAENGVDPGPAPRFLRRG